MSHIVTRFAPSPTGFLHIGSARTALFNYLFARKHNGKFLLRIEDTDQSRNSQPAIDEIFNSMRWLGLLWDDEPIFQSSRAARHREVAYELLEKNAAYYCFTSQEEVNALRDQAQNKKEHFIFQSKWRDAPKSQHPQDIKPVIRLRSPREGSVIINDLLQGKVEVASDHIDDMIILRSDGTPTYMLAVVVDDHDSNVTHIIRGDDHLNNALRQKIIYEGMGWKVPEMVHIPLIHGMDGAKLSKRHGALGTSQYKDMGYLPEALLNYLLRLGWSHGDDEIISIKQAIEWFDLEHLGKSPSRLDFDKMKHINSVYIKNYDNEQLAEMICQSYPNISAASKSAIIQSMDELKPRANLLTQLVAMVKMLIIEDQLEISPEAASMIKTLDTKLIESVMQKLKAIDNNAFNKAVIQDALKECAESLGLKLGELMQQVRPLITGQISSPSVFAIISAIGKDATLQRLGQCQ